MAHIKLVISCQPLCIMMIMNSINYIAFNFLYEIIINQLK